MTSSPHQSAIELFLGRMSPRLQAAMVQQVTQQVTPATHAAASVPHEGERPKPHLLIVRAGVNEKKQDVYRILRLEPTENKEGQFVAGHWGEIYELPEKSMLSLMKNDYALALIWLGDDKKLTFVACTDEQLRAAKRPEKDVKFCVQYRRKTAPASLKK